MKTRAEYIDMIRSHADDLKSKYGVTSLRIFGSVAREQQTESSDLDVCVEMPPRIFKLVGVGTYLEELLGCHVDHNIIYEASKYDLPELLPAIDYFIEYLQKNHNTQQ